MHRLMYCRCVLCMFVDRLFRTRLLWCFLYMPWSMMSWVMSHEPPLFGGDWKHSIVTSSQRPTPYSILARGGWMNEWMNELNHHANRVLSLCRLPRQFSMGRGRAGFRCARASGTTTNFWNDGTFPSFMQTSWWPSQAKSESFHQMRHGSIYF